MDEVSTLIAAATLFERYTLPEKKKGTERGELLKYFSQKLNRPISYVATKLKGMQDLQTLYFIKSDCDQAEQRGVPWGAAFHTSIKVK